MTNNHDYTVIRGLGFGSDKITFYKCSDSSIGVSCNYFCGSLDDYEKKMTGDNLEHSKEFEYAIAAIREHFK